MSMLQEFKEFAMKGNVVDLAIGVVIGGAFGKIVDSLVNDIIMPIIGAVTGGVDFTNMFVQLTGGAKQATYEAAKKAGATLGYGSFLTAVVMFLIIAAVLFMVVKAINTMKKQEAAAADVSAAPEAPPADIQLLSEIRDLLKR